jgi:hypothetical protein
MQGVLELEQSWVLWLVSGSEEAWANQLEWVLDSLLEWVLDSLLEWVLEWR